MEIVAMDMKLRGMYIARQLSFQGVTFNVNEVVLTQEFKKIYNKAVRLVSFVLYCLSETGYLLIYIKFAQL